MPTMSDWFTTVMYNLCKTQDTQSKTHVMSSYTKQRVSFKKQYMILKD